MRIVGAADTSAGPDAVSGAAPVPTPLDVGSGPVPERVRLSDTVLRARLLRSLDAAMADPAPHAMAALRAVVTDLVDRMRALGVPLERVVAAVETLLREHGTPRRGLALHDDDAPAAERREATVHARLFEWCVGAYRDDAWW